MSFQLTYKPFGPNAILIAWPQVITVEILKDIKGFQSNIEQEYIDGISEFRVAYNSLLVTFSNQHIHFEVLVLRLKAIYEQGASSEPHPVTKWEIPVCYNSTFGIDLEALAHTKQLSVAELIQRHTAPVYTVYFIGFLPGFLYLGGLDEVLHTPRKATPRLQIEAGAVAIGGNQTGIYPSKSPGGWHIIGKSPVSFFNASHNPPCFAQPGDQIQFKPISEKEFNSIRNLVQAGRYNLSKTEVTC